MITLLQLVRLTHKHTLSLPAVGNAEGHGLRVGDKLLEVNGCSVRGFSHQQAGALFTESPGGKVSLLVYSVKPSPKPSGMCATTLLKFAPCHNSILYTQVLW